MGRQKDRMTIRQTHRKKKERKKENFLEFERKKQ
jgi:hypothetical protein